MPNCMVTLSLDNLICDSLDTLISLHKCSAVDVSARSGHVGDTSTAIPEVRYPQ